MGTHETLATQYHIVCYMNGEHKQSRAIDYYVTFEAHLGALKLYQAAWNFVFVYVCMCIIRCANATHVFIG